MRALLLAFLATTAPVGCVKKLALHAMADQLASGTGGAFTRDDDLAFVGEALPFTLKLMESVHESTPEHPGLTLALCSGFTQYAVVYVLWPAERVRQEDLDAYEGGLERGRRMLARARGYCFEGLEQEHPGFGVALEADPDAALAPITAESVPLLYWASAASLARISISKEDPEAIGGLPAAAAMAHRALVLDDTWAEGSVHELLIQLEPSLPLPGGAKRSRDHYARALELSGGRRASVHVALAESVSLPAQDHAEFDALLAKALAVEVAADPDGQLANLYAQERAQFLLARADDLFLE